MAKDLIADDGVLVTHRSTIRFNSADPFIGYDVATATFKRSQVSATINFNYNVDQAGFRLRILGFDHGANQWIELDSRVASTSASTINVPVANPTNYIRSSDGAIMIRVVIEANGPIATSTVKLFSDRLVWIEN